MKTIVEYIWIDGILGLRSKGRVLNGKVSSLDDVPEWNYDGSSTEQAVTESSEIILKPCAIFNCPFRKGNNKLVMCSSYNLNGTPAKNNNRHWAETIFNQKKEEEPWYGMEQEFFFIDPRTGSPLGYISDNKTEEQGKYYCSVGYDRAFGRHILEQFLERALYTGITISGVNGEVAPGQWEYQVGPTIGIDTCDQLWVSRYILERTAEENGVLVSLHPKPLKGDWNGSGCHMNFSTKSMRENDNGLKLIQDSMVKLEGKHKEHMDVYGNDNNQRLTGAHETSDMNTFSVGNGHRGCSIRIPVDTIKNKKGYFEDRRPASNIDPYLACAKIYETVVL